MRVILKVRYCAFGVFVYMLLAYATAFGQRDKFEEGYIITLQGDSVYGRIAIQEAALSARTCVFKGQANEIKTYSPNEIKAYGIGVKKRYDAYSIKTGETNETVFLNNLVKGKVSLLYYQERYFVDSGNGAQELVTARQMSLVKEKSIRRSCQCIRERCRKQ